MERISQWVASQEIPPDLTVRIADSVFPLHKAVMVAKCGYIRRAVAASCTNTELDLSAIPGGAEAFEKAARYCYGASNDLEITASNAAALRCAAAFLDMDDSGLGRRVDEFLSHHSGLRTLPNAVAVLRSCERLLPAAEELGIVRRAADAVALRICNEAMFPSTTSGPPGLWAAELAALSPASFGKVVTALRFRRAGPEVIATVATAYVELVVLGDGDKPDHQKGNTAFLIESVVEVLPSASDAPLPVSFLCRLLHAAVNTCASTKTCRDLELRVAAVLDQATAGDLLGERVTNTDTVRRVIAAFVERQQQHHLSNTNSKSRTRRASLSSGRGGRGEAEEEEDRMEKVARTVDDLAAEIATEEALPVSKFVGLIGAVPKEARKGTHDWVYRAVDIYLKTHPELDEIEREKVCSVMDPLKLSYQARLHASQNKRLPLQAVLTALYYDHLKIRSGSAGAEELMEYESQSAAGNRARAQARADASLARENEALRSELARMRAYLSGVHHSTTSKGSGSSPPVAAGKKKKKTNHHSFLGSVTRTLSKFNPFKAAAWGPKDTSTIITAHGRHHGNDHVVVKPKRRRFSIS